MISDLFASMHPLLADFDPGTLTAFFIFAGGGILTMFAGSMGWLCAHKGHRKEARFCYYSALVLGVLTVLLILFSLRMGNKLGWL
jgi:hypothetical protein